MHIIRISVLPLSPPTGSASCRPTGRPRARRRAGTAAGIAKPRNPRHFDGIEGGRKRVSDTFTHKNSGSDSYVLMHIAEHNHCFMQYFGVKTLSETFFSQPSMKPGYGPGLGIVSSTTARCSRRRAWLLPSRISTQRLWRARAAGSARASSSGPCPAERSRRALALLVTL